ncbi:hypothetical protein JAAARDRAFT_193652 [Jaapia argillacea MUCL 33604]|uniref:Uncharacterized protein n=1 Tax=Jaapia argillacea MUCL 33604 TaxID=933084 RepID=A0A067PU13_9AGAM|nr:hypothetical protein JAAARDRAFT_193652 [Jaapia argillacea MUCL 33604]
MLTTRNPRKRTAPTIIQRMFACWIFSILCIQPAIASTSFLTCFEEVQAGTWGTIGGTDSHGNAVPVANASGITHDLCVRACGSGPEPFSWSTFSPQFGAWLLPYLAIVSQLPFGTGQRLGNLVSVFLAVGSPTLAGYTLALTVLNTRWVARRFQGITYPNAKAALAVLTALQQSSFSISSRSALLPSLVVLPQNDEWWRELTGALADSTSNTWTIAAAVSVAWVVVTFALTLIDAFSNIMNQSHSDFRPSLFGQSVGFLWLWTVPIVVGWLQLSPICDQDHIQRLFTQINVLAFVGTPNGVVEAGRISEQRAIAAGDDADDQSSMRRGNADSKDASLSATVYYYARVFSWCDAVEDVAQAFSAASTRAKAHRSVDPKVKWKSHGVGEEAVHPDNRIGSENQVTQYCGWPPMSDTHASRAGISERILLAGLFALGLQWGTTGAAILVVYLTPTVGLGCRSGAYLLYGIVSTIVWILMLISSAIAYHTNFDSHTSVHPRSAFSPILSYLSAPTSMILRRIAKILATLNSIWILLISTLQFSNFFDRCYCNSSALSLGAKAYAVIQNTVSDLDGVRSAWIGGSVLAIGASVVFIALLNTLMD